MELKTFIRTIQKKCTPPNLQLVVSIGSILAFLLFWFQYFSVPMAKELKQLSSFQASNALRGIFWEIFQVIMQEEPVFALLFILLFVAPNMLLLAGAILQLANRSSGKTDKRTCIITTVACGYLCLFDIVFAIALKIFNDHLLDGASDLLSTAVTVGPAWWLQLLFAVTATAASAALLVPLVRQNSLSAPALIGVKGRYSGCAFPIEVNDRLILGRDASVCNIIFDETDSGISRCHCTIGYNSLQNTYFITDYSSNGTYIVKNGQKIKLPYGQTAYTPGAFLEIGSDKTVMKLR